MESTWETRELPVLEAVVAICERERFATTEAIEDETGLDHVTVQAALSALKAEQPPFFEIPNGPRRLSDTGIVAVAYPSGHARRTVGAWPTPENLADRIVAALHEEADREPDPDEKSKLQHAADVGKGAIAGVISTVITQGV